MSASLLEWQLRRIDRLWQRFERTGDERWMDAAIEADRFYRRMVALGVNR